MRRQASDRSLSGTQQRSQKCGVVHVCDHAWKESPLFRSQALCRKPPTRDFCVSFKAPPASRGSSALGCREFRHYPLSLSVCPKTIVPRKTAIKVRKTSLQGDRKRLCAAAHRVRPLLLQKRNASCRVWMCMLLPGVAAGCAGLRSPPAQRHALELKRDRSHAAISCHTASPFSRSPQLTAGDVQAPFAWESGPPGRVVFHRGCLNVRCFIHDFSFRSR